jgi:RNA 3'-terminal phosphate cyclase (ATP)
VIDIDIGTPGAISLVLQTILVPAIAMGEQLTCTISGGTHNPMAPPFDFLERVFLPHLRAMGADVRLELNRYGFAPGEGRSDSLGSVTMSIGSPVPTDRDGQRAADLDRKAIASRLRPIEILEAGPVSDCRATAMLCRLPTHVAERELTVVMRELGWGRDELVTREVRANAIANVLMLEVNRGASRELITVHGEKGLPAERVAKAACDELAAFLALDVPVGEHLADQLLLPMAVAGGGRFRTGPLSLHATTNIDTIHQFLDVPIRCDEASGTTTVSIG